MGIKSSKFKVVKAKMAKLKRQKDKLKTGIFVDDANLFYAQKKAGWRVDYGKLKELLSQEVEVAFIHYHFCLPAKWDNARAATEKYLEKIKDQVVLKPKPLKYIRVGGQLLKKGDVDLEIALDVVRNLEKLDLVIVVSGDSDYVELRKFVLEKGKKILFLGFKVNMAWEIKQGKYLLLDKIRPWIELNKKTPPKNRRRLLLSILYQEKRRKSS